MTQAATPSTVTSQGAAPSTATATATTAAAPTAGNAASTCTGCAKALPEGADRCPNCGLAFGEHQRCPLCAAIAPVRRSPRLRSVCAACGRPRIHGGDAALPCTADQAEALRVAGRSSLLASTWKALGWMSLGFGLLSELVLWGVLSVVEATDTAVTLGNIGAAIPIVLGLDGLRRGARARRRANDIIDSAWADAVTELGRRAGHPIDAAALAETTGIDVITAAQVLASKAVKARSSSSASGATR